jgi:hypothetical protein
MIIVNIRERRALLRSLDGHRQSIQMRGIGNSQLQVMLLTEHLLGAVREEVASGSRGQMRKNNLICHVIALGNVNYIGPVQITASLEVSQRFELFW